MYQQLICITGNIDTHSRVLTLYLRAPQIGHANLNIGYKVNREFGYCDIFNPSYSLRLLSRVEINTESLT